MTMDLMRSSIIFVLVHFVHAGHVYISANHSDWEQARHMCNLATGELQFFNEEITVLLNSTAIQGTFTNKDKLWIGYMKTLTALLYRGCSAKSGILQSPNHTDISADPGTCYSFCRSRFIGVELDKICYCLSSIPQDIRNGHCNLSCTHPAQTSCGEKNTSVAIYEQVPYDKTSGKAEKRFCRAFEKGVRKFFWDQCGSYNKHFCLTDFSLNNRAYYVVGTSFNVWLKINNDCLKDGHFPVKEQVNFSPNISETAPLWTGSIRSYIVSPVTDTLGNQEEFEQGYVEYTGKEFRLKFGAPKGKLRALCTKEAVPPFSSTHTFSSLRIETQTPTGIAESENDDSKVAVYVVAPVVVLVIAAALAAIFIWKRRKRLANEKGRESNYIDPSTQPHLQSRLQTGASNVGYEDDYNPSNEKQTIDYLDLQAYSGYATVEDTVNTQEEEYDTTVGTRFNHPVNESVNEYNTFNDAFDDTYNHCTRTTIKAEDTYNHTGNHGIDYYEGVHDTGPSFNVLASNAEGTYNHIVT